MPKKKKQGATTFEGGEGATANVTVEKPKFIRKPDPAFVEKQKERKDKRDRKKRRANDDVVWEGYKK